MADKLAKFKGLSVVIAEGDSPGVEASVGNSTPTQGPSRHAPTTAPARALLHQDSDPAISAVPAYSRRTSMSPQIRASDHLRAALTRRRSTAVQEGQSSPAIWTKSSRATNSMNSLPTPIDELGSAELKSARRGSGLSEAGSVADFLEDNDRKAVSQLSADIPNTALRWVASACSEMDQDGSPTPELPCLQVTRGVIMFSDISGFTRLGNALVKQEADSAPEALARITNSYFSTHISLINNYGGDVIKFVGDAMIVYFPTLCEKDRCIPDGVCDDGLREAVARASECALELISATEGIKSSMPVERRLDLHVAIGAGELSNLVVGNLEGRVDCFVAGGALDQIRVMGDLVKPGEVGLSGSAYSIIRKDTVEVVAVRGENAAAGAHTNPDSMCYIISSVEHLSRGGIHRQVDNKTRRDQLLRSIMKHPFEIVDAAVGSVVPDAVLAGSGGMDEEFRYATILFMLLTDAEGRQLDYSSHERVNQLQECLLYIYHSVLSLEGTVFGFVVDDKGTIVNVAFGLPPISHEDDAHRAMQVATAVNRHINSTSHTRVSIGACTGKVIYVFTGSKERRQLTVLGEKVNQSARLMGKATKEFGILCDEDCRRAAEAGFNFESKGTVSLKGYEHHLNVFSPTTARKKVKGTDFFLTPAQNNAAPSHFPSPMGKTPLSFRRRYSMRRPTIRGTLGPDDANAAAAAAAVAAVAAMQIKEGSEDTGSDSENSDVCVTHEEETEMSGPGPFTRDVSNSIAKKHFFGRSNEVDELVKLISRHMESDSAISKGLVLEGVAGVGKTELAHAVLNEAKGLGHAVMYHQAEALEQTTPYGVWSDVLRELITRRQAARAGPGAMTNQHTLLVEGLKHYLGRCDWKRYMSLLNDVLGVQIEAPSPVVQNLNEATKHKKERDMMCYLLRMMASEENMVLVLDNTRNFDVHSWRLLRAILKLEADDVVLPTPQAPSKRNTSVNLFLEGMDDGLGTTQHDEINGRIVILIPTRDITSPLESLLKLRTTTLIPIQPLSERDEGELVEFMLSGCIQHPQIMPKLCASIYKRTKGHPLFATHLCNMVRDMETVLSLRDHPNVGSTIEKMLQQANVPSDGRNAIVATFDRLPRLQKKILKMVSVVECECPLELLESLLGLHVHQDLLELDQMGLIGYNQEDGVCAFGQPLVQEVIYQVIPFSVRRIHHTEVARWFENELIGDTADKAGNDAPGPGAETKHATINVQMVPFAALLSYHWEKVCPRQDYVAEASGEDMDALYRFAVYSIIRAESVGSLAISVDLLGGVLDTFKRVTSSSPHLLLACKARLMHHHLMLVAASMGIYNSSMKDLVSSLCAVLDDMRSVSELVLTDAEESQSVLQRPGSYDDFASVQEAYNQSKFLLEWNSSFLSLHVLGKTSRSKECITVLESCAKHAKAIDSPEVIAAISTLKMSIDLSENRIDDASKRSAALCNDMSRLPDMGNLLIMRLSPYVHAVSALLAAAGGKPYRLHFIALEKLLKTEQRANIRNEVLPIMACCLLVSGEYEHLGSIASSVSRMSLDAADFEVFKYRLASGKDLSSKKDGGNQGSYQVLLRLLELSARVLPQLKRKPPSGQGLEYQVMLDISMAEDAVESVMQGKDKEGVLHWQLVCMCYVLALIHNTAGQHDRASEYLTQARDLNRIAKANSCRQFPDDILAAAAGSMIAPKTTFNKTSSSE